MTVIPLWWPMHVERRVVVEYADGSISKYGPYALISPERCMEIARESSAAWARVIASPVTRIRCMSRDVQSIWDVDIVET